MKVRLIALVVLALGLAVGVPTAASHASARPLAGGTTVYTAPAAGGPGACCV